MEWWQLLIAFWFGGVVLAMWKIWRPALSVLQKVQPENPMSRQPILSSIVILVLFTLFLPVMVVAILFDDKGYQFTESFIKGAMNKNDD